MVTESDYGELIGTTSKLSVVTGSIEFNLMDEAWLKTKFTKMTEDMRKGPFFFRRDNTCICSLNGDTGAPKMRAPLYSSTSLKVILENK